MTTYHTSLETDGVPAPSDFELAAADATTFKCGNCGTLTDQPVQIRNDPESPLWCEKCAYENIPDYKRFVDSSPQLCRIRPFIAVTRNRLVTIVGQLPSGVYVDSTGLFHLPQNLTRDLDAYAEQQAADYRDLADTQADALR